MVHFHSSFFGALSVDCGAIGSSNVVTYATVQWRLRNRCCSYAFPLLPQAAGACFYCGSFRLYSSMGFNSAVFFFYLPLFSAKIIALGFAE